jgi:putative oxidoreductase
MYGDSTSLIFPGMSSLYGSAALWAEVVLRVVTGLALVPHGLRATFGLFKNTGSPILSLSMLRKSLHAAGYKPAALWAPAIAMTELVAGPLLALGLFTRLAALPIAALLVVSNVQRWRQGGYFYDTRGIEYTLLWTAAAVFFLARGGGEVSLDHLLLKREF